MRLSFRGCANCASTLPWSHSSALSAAGRSPSGRKGVNARLRSPTRGHRPQTVSAGSPISSHAVVAAKGYARPATASIELLSMAGLSNSSTRATSRSRRRSTAVPPIVRTTASWRSRCSSGERAGSSRCRLDSAALSCGSAAGSAFARRESRSSAYTSLWCVTPQLAGPTRQTGPAARRAV